MSEVAPRPSAPRVRGSSRGGRAGFARGGRGGFRQTNGDQSEATDQPKIEDQGEIGKLKSMYASNLTTIKELFPAWTDEDIVFALQESSGDLNSTIDRMASGKNRRKPSHP